MDSNNLAPSKHVVDSKWVYKVKFKLNGMIDRYKVCLIARGLKQIEGINYHETFAPVATVVFVYCLPMIIVKCRWIVYQLDVDNAFLYGDLIEEVYMKLL